MRKRMLRTLQEATARTGVRLKSREGFFCPRRYLLPKMNAQGKSAGPIRIEANSFGKASDCSAAF